MSELKKEIVDLHEHVSQLYMIVKQLSDYIGYKGVNGIDLAFNAPSIAKLSSSSNGNSHNVNHSSSKHRKDVSGVNDNLYLLDNHKDILVDDKSVHPLLSDQENFSDIISCEEQVHRLTAQLTAAYYRIASLEEQLLAIRNQVETRDNGFYQCQ